MLIDPCPHVKAKSEPENTSLFHHTRWVHTAIEKFAVSLDFEADTACVGAVLHDIGKACPLFQKRLKPGRHSKKPIFRHEIASCLFLSLADEKWHPPLIEMIIAHHKSVKEDHGEKGLLDLEENVKNVFKHHSQDWENWSRDALKIIAAFNIPTHPISLEKARHTYEQIVRYSNAAAQKKGYSTWRGLLMAADHFASALDSSVSVHLDKTFIPPVLDFFSRTSGLYPLSLKKADSDKPHTMVVACTGAGKTDYLFRRCRGRIFYTLPFQASINAMYDRVKSDLKATNPGLDIRLVHAASRLSVLNESLDEVLLQRLAGAGIKILTPYQLASIIFATKGFESLILDIRHCDVILDEIHTYNGVAKSMVLKIVEVLNHLGCRIHIGTATMPTALFDKLLAILGKDHVSQVSLTKEELDMFDRHRLFKIGSWEDAFSEIDRALGENAKILLISNRVDSAQKIFEKIRNKYPEIPSMAIHSRFKRKDRQEKEKKLRGMDQNGNSTHEFNTGQGPCIVVSTQVVEVSLDISFDMMITETAPIDALIQRFGRINRKRNADTLGSIKPVFLLPPPEDAKDALPYGLETLQKTFEIMEHGRILHESDYQEKIDFVYPDPDLTDIEAHAVFKKDGTWSQPLLVHNHKSIFLDLLEIDNAAAIVNSDKKAYEAGTPDQQKMLEIPVRLYSVRKEFEQSTKGKAFVLPDAAYCQEKGLDMAEARKRQIDLNII